MLSKLFILLITVYQKFISPFFVSSCRFTPTCSEYAREAFMKYGVIKGTYLFFKRITACHPWGRDGYDPVP